MINKTGLVLCSGHGSRMAELSQQLKLPKHLFPIFEQQTIAGRIIDSLGRSGCERIICTIKDESQRGVFEDAFKGLSYPVELLVKRDSKSYSELGQISEVISKGNVIQVNGDLVFPGGALEKFVQRFGDFPFFVRGREGNKLNQSSAVDIFNSRVSIVPVGEIGNFAFNSAGRKYKALKLFMTSLLLKRVVSVPTLFNVDTPEIYKQAKDYFRIKQ